MDWEDKFRVLKGKSLQPRILCSARLLDYKEREKIFRQAKAKKIQKKKKNKKKKKQKKLDIS